MNKFWNINVLFRKYRTSFALFIFLIFALSLLAFLSVNKKSIVIGYSHVIEQTTATESLHLISTSTRRSFLPSYASPVPNHEQTMPPTRTFGRDSVEMTNLDILLDQSQIRKGLPLFRKFENRDEYFADHCDSCAVVTSSGYLLGKRAGERIDSHQCVIRMNDSPTNGFHKDVGSRVTHRVVGHPTVKIGRMPGMLRQDLKKSATTYLVWGPTDSLTQTGPISKWASASLKTIKPKPKIFMSFGTENDTYGIQYFDEVWNLEKMKTKTKSKVWLSTGFFTVVTALNFCNSITIFGLDAKDQNCDSEDTISHKYHYYQMWPTPTACDFLKKNENDRGFSHTFFSEYKMFHRWSQFRNISFDVSKT